MEIRQAYNFIYAVYFESKSDRVLIYVILLSSDCFKVQGHLVPRLMSSGLTKDLLLFNLEVRKKNDVPCTMQDNIRFFL